MSSAGGASTGRTGGPAPAAAGVRFSWPAIPASLRDAVEMSLGARVVEAITQQGGFSPGVASRLLLSDGRRAFVKAVGPQPNPDSPDIYRSEATIAAALPIETPAPRLLSSFDQDGWVVLLFEDVEGTQPAQPWVEDELSRVLAAVGDLARSLTPAPVKAPPVEVRFGDQFQGWGRLAEAHHRGEDDLEGLDQWARRHLPQLAAMEAGWGAAAGGSTLAHADLRADNMLLTHDGVMVVDWPWACVAAPWFDLLTMLPSVRMQGGPPCESLFAGHPVSESADQRAVTLVLAAWAGYLVQRSRQPAPPGLPTLREFQGAQGLAALDWLRVRTGWR